MSWQAKRFNLLQVIAAKGNLRNSVFSFAQTGVTIICFFLCYRILIKSEGLGALGLWSFLIAFGGMARVLDVSGASTLSRFVARHQDETDENRRPALIHTLLLTSLMINFSIAFVVIFIGYMFIVPSLDPSQQANASDVLPWIAIVLLISPLSAGVSSAVDGLHRADLRSIFVGLAAVSTLVVTWLLVPILGVTGFALGQIVQHVVVYVCCWQVLRQKIPELGYFPKRWHIEIFKETYQYSIKMNAIGLIGILFEPFTKILIGTTGGTAALGIYELASRLVIQIRALVLGGAAPLLPLFSAMTLTSKSFTALLVKTTRISTFASLGVCIFSLLGSPVVSYFMLGSFDVQLLEVNAILTWGWAINLCAVPFYISAQAAGILRWNFISHLISAICVVIFGLGIVMAVAWYSVVVGTAVGLVLGTICTIVGNATALKQMPVLRSFAVNFIAMSMVISGLCAVAILAIQWIGVTP